MKKIKFKIEPKFTNTQAIYIFLEPNQELNGYELYI